ncbi:hypothetical protein [Helicobacter winghamensis]|uniref:Uncharacterized protein n=1 Tax=Helicobacter winghamensis TaxID=157268 RepID=A0A2N3PK87_9HELI|nr:hypothetical protein [Helicobacter winghamensis]PKT77603.1 hypothetical protein BCM32_05260 [Helicobacter winghamensis]PKT81841.1 hypothetical protein BCM31_01255 [Helicobacter winghamensis]PKT82020.1 hypothetical protein BCM33_00520 [Helicobacter winghamensis]
MEKTLRKQIKQGKITFYPVLLKVSKNCIVRHIEIFFKNNKGEFYKLPNAIKKKITDKKLSKDGLIIMEGYGMDMLWYCMKRLESVLNIEIDSMKFYEYKNLNLFVMCEICKRDYYGKD